MNKNVRKLLTEKKFRNSKSVTKFDFSIWRVDIVT